MRFDKLTQKGQEAVLEAQNLAQEYRHPAVEPEHLLLALVAQEGGGVVALIKHIGADAQMVHQSLTQALGRMARATGSTVQVGLSRDLANVIEEAEEIAAQMKDDTRRRSTRRWPNTAVISPRRRAKASSIRSSAVTKKSGA